MAADREWLDQFPPEWRGGIGTFFYHVVRESAKGIALAELSPRLICSDVYRSLADELRRQGQPGHHGVSKLTVLRALQKDPAAAQRFAAWVILQESRSPEQKQRDKEAHEADGKRRYMESQPVTEKQRAFLKDLGCPDEPANRWEASEMIEAWRTRL